MDILFKRSKKQRGAVLLLVLALSVVVIPLIQEVWLSVQLEYRFKRQRMHNLQARYNAKSGLGLSLLRIYIFKGIEKSLTKEWETLSRPLLDRVWSFPFVWPLPIPEDGLESEREELENMAKQSFLKGSYGVFISPEDGLLNINDLSSPLNSLRQMTYEALFNLLQQAVEDDPDLKDRYSPKDLEEVLNNLSDWTDADQQSQNGGSEDLVEEGVKPLNRSFMSLEEVKKTPGMDSALFQILEPNITVYGTKALNMNYARSEILQALNIPQDVVNQILSRTQRNSENYSPFPDQKTFCSFLDDFGFPFCEELKDRYQTLDMLAFSYPSAFRIKSVGSYRESFITLESLLFDLSSTALHYQKSRYYQIERQKQEEEGGKSPPQTPKEENLQENKPQRGSFDYSFSKSLIIMYVKEKP